MGGASVDLRSAELGRVRCRREVGVVTAIFCATCGTEAAAGQPSCGICGAALPIVCAACGTANPPDHRFCGQCGTKLDSGIAGATSTPPAARSNGRARAPIADVGAPATPVAPPATFAAPVAERRLVSVLFADLVGFTPFSEGRDAEDVREALTRYFGIATETITRHGGVVEKFIGDAVMAVWGTPTTHEDDAERAVRAGLELVAAVPAVAPGIEARCGVLTGEAAVTIGATNQGMVAGDIVNTAARLQSAAAPSTVLVGESTFRAASGAIAFEPAGVHALKGKAAPVPTWRALRIVAERGGRGRVEGLDAPFVGRDVELRLLKELYHVTGSERRTQHVSMIGAGGIGKSRLTWELEKYLDGIAEPVYWHRGRSPAYGQGITFRALGEIVRARGGLAESDDEATSRARIGALLDELMPESPDRVRVESALLQLLGVEGDVPPDELFGAWRTFFEQLAASGTVVLVFEDLHWADAGTLDFVDHLVDWARDHPIFVLSLARPELLERRPEWGTPRRGHASLVLESVPEGDMRRLLDGLVPSLPDATATAIVARAEGVPLYAVEMVRMLSSKGQLRLGDSGVLEPAGDLGQLADLAVPETLTALIAARLDALAPQDRALVLDAAVLGQSFSPAGLAAVSGRAESELEPRLRSLVRRELLTHVVDPRSPERGHYAFVQALIREVAYRTLARADRRTRHLAVARWLESLGDPELVAAFASHYLAAVPLARPGEEADELATKAQVALRAAGDRAAALGSPAQARTFYEEALGLTTDATDQAVLLMLAGEKALASAEFDAADAHLARAVEIRRTLGDRQALAQALAERARVLLGALRFDQAAAVIEPAIAEFADLAADPAVLSLRDQHARLVFLSGPSERAIELASPLLDLAESSDQPAILASSLITIGSALSMLGRHAEGRPLLARARRIVEENGPTDLQLRALSNAYLLEADEDMAKAWELGLEAHALATRLGELAHAHRVAGTLSSSAIWLGHVDAGERMFASALDDTTDPNDRALPLGSLVVQRVWRGETYGDELAEILATAEGRTEGFWRMTRDELLGYAALAEGRIDDARDLWRPIAPDPDTFALVQLVAHLDLWRADPDAAERVIEAGVNKLPDAGASALVRRALTAGISGLRGDRAAALDSYREIIPTLRECRVPLQDVLFAIDLVHVIGPDDPFVAEEVTLARETIDRLGSPLLLRLLEAAKGPRAEVAAH